MSSHDCDADNHRQNRKGRVAEKRGRKPKAVPVDNLQQLIQAKKFVDQIGGLEKGEGRGKRAGADSEVEIATARRAPPFTSSVRLPGRPPRRPQCLEFVKLPVLKWPWHRLGACTAIGLADIGHSCFGNLEMRS